VARAEHLEHVHQGGLSAEPVRSGIQKCMQFDDPTRELGIGDGRAVEGEIVGEGEPREHVLRQIEHPVGPPLRTVGFAGVHLARGYDDDVAGALRDHPVAIADLARPRLDRAEREGVVKVWREAVTSVGSFRISNGVSQGTTVRRANSSSRCIVGIRVDERTWPGVVPARTSQVSRSDPRIPSPATRGVGFAS
jgi:hypothetical protein